MQNLGGGVYFTESEDFFCDCSISKMAFFVDRSGSETTIKTTAKNENSGLLIGSKKRSTNAERKMQRAKAIAKRRLSRKDVPDSSNSFDLWSTTIEEDLKEKTFVDSKSEFTIVLEQKKRRVFLPCISI